MVRGFGGTEIGESARGQRTEKGERGWRRSEVGREGKIEGKVVNARVNRGVVALEVR